MQPVKSASSQSADPTRANNGVTAHRPVPQSSGDFRNPQQLSMKGFPPHTVTLGLIKSTSRSSATGFIGHTTIKPREINVNTNGDSIITEHHLASEYDQFPVGIAGGIKHLMRKSMERCQALTGNTNKNSLNPKISEILNDTILNKYPTQSENAWAFVYANKELFGKNVDSYYLFRARSTRDADEKRVDFLVFGFDESKLEYFLKTAMVPRENQLKGTSRNPIKLW